MIKRSRGAPTGNTNALKHGFYSRQFRNTDINDLDVLLETGLESEINMLRVSSRRLLEFSQDNTDVEQGIKLLSVLGATATRLANLMRSQSILGGGAQDDTMDTIIQALRDVNKEICK